MAQGDGAASEEVSGEEASGQPADRGAPGGHDQGRYDTDAIIIGAGPAGLFSVFELGLLGLSCQVIETLDGPGGQCAELYPEKAILDIPTRATCTGQELTDLLMAQIAPFDPVFHFAQMATNLTRLDGGGFRIATDAGTDISAPVIVVAAGGGSFIPKKPRIDGLEPFEGSSVFYAVRRKADFEGRRIVIAGGGDSALDWVDNLLDVADRITLVHRREEFRAHEATTAHVRGLIQTGHVDFVMGEPVGLKGDPGALEAVVVKRKDGGDLVEVPADAFLPFYGLTMTMGPVGDFGLDQQQGRICVNTENFETSEPGIFAVGDICYYPGKLKLILSGFHEAALMAHAAHGYARPGEKTRFAHTTSNAAIQKRVTG